MRPASRTLEQEIAALRRTLRVLRGPRGCPWDREQDLDDLISYLIEEAYELLHAEKTKDWREVEGELGDVFFILIFIHELLLAKRRTPLARIVANVHRKIVNRHPHVFGSAKARTTAQSLAEWNRIKQAEPGRSARPGTLRHISTKLPPFRRAAAVQKKAAEIGFDWPDHAGILDKLHEEIDELTKEIPAGRREGIKDEIGDIFFTVVNLARHLHVDSESAIESTTAKFMTRFSEIEKQAKRAGGDIRDMGLDEMERLWQKSKRTRRRRRTI